MTAQLTNYAMAAQMPLVRPDSYVERFIGGGWCLRTPSCWGGEGNPPIKIEDGDIPDGLIGDLIKIGEVVAIPSEKFPGAAKKYLVQGQIIDPEWWKNMAESGALGDLDLSKWGVV